jgi:hypothetical protein
MTPPEQEVYAYLDTLDIPFRARYEHPPVGHRATRPSALGRIDATHAKNLFLRNQRGDRHISSSNAFKRVDLRHPRRPDWRRQAELRLSPSAMMTHLGVTPGASLHSRTASTIGTITCASSSIADLRSALARFVPSERQHRDRGRSAAADFERYLAARANAVQYIDMP